MEFQDIFQRQLREAGEEILQAISETASTKYVSDGEGRAQPTVLTSRSGRLRGALQNPAHRKVYFTEDAAHFQMAFPDELARIYQMHETGGTRPISDRMRGYFWFRYFQNDGMYPREMWAYLAKRGTVLTYPRRSFMQDAFRDNLTKASEIVKRYTGQALDLTLKRIIQEAKEVSK